MKSMSIEHTQFKRNANLHQYEKFNIDVLYIIISYEILVLVRTFDNYDCEQSFHVTK